MAAWRRRFLAAFARWLAAGVLVVSILPVLLFGSSLLHAPARLAHELRVDVRRLAWRGPPTDAGCSPRFEARALRLARLAGRRARLSWSAPSGARDGGAPVYRVLRAGRVVGQTTRSSIVMRITPGARTTYTVQARYASAGSASAGSACSATLRAALPFRPPGRVSDLRALAGTSSGVLIGWRAAAAGDAPIVGYRVERNGSVVGQTRRLQYGLRISGGRSNRLTVAGVDTLGHVGQSAVLVIGPRGGVQSTPAAGAPLDVPASAPQSAGSHRAPNPPSLLSAVHVSDTSVTLSWQAGSANEGSVKGYLLYEDGQPLGVVEGQIATVALASEREYTFAVRTMDSYGDLSEPTPELEVLTTHTPPPPPSGLSASDVTGESAVLRWSPSTAVSGTIVGYRVFRDEIPVGQTSATEMPLANLAPNSEYQFTVSAVDSLGALSQPTSPVTVHTGAPPPTRGGVQAYVLSSTDESFEDLQSHYEQVGVIYPTYFECGDGGSVLGGDDPLLTRWSLERKIEVLPRVNCQNIPYEEQILNEPAVREQMIDRLAALCQTYGYEGVQIDFEGAPPSEREPFTTFVTLLAERLHAQGDKLSTVVTAKYYNVPTGRAAMYNDAALAGPSDYVFVLDWGIHWTTSGPGSIDEYSWFKRVAEYTATLPDRQKFVLGMPLYGLDWPDGGGPIDPGTAMEYESIVALASQLGATPEWEANAQSPHFSYTENGVGHEVWYVDKQSLEPRAALAQSLGLKVGLWRLGTEDQTIWELPQLGGEGQ
jgi:spore germination protein YaaH